MKKTLFLAGIFLLAMAGVNGQQTLPAENKKFEKKRLKVTKAEKAAFQNFLKGKRSGIIKLWNNPCSNSPVVDATDEKCFSDISLGSHYSFFAKVYFEKYRHVKYAAVSLEQGEFVVKNHPRLTQLLVDLGARDIGEIDERTEEVMILSSFPIFDRTEQEIFGKSGDGYEFRGLTIANRRRAELNRTFLLRSFFEEGFRSLIGGKRETLFVFQVVGQESDLITILWKEIYSKHV